MAFTPDNFMSAERALDQMSVEGVAAMKNVERAIEQIEQNTAILENLPNLKGWKSTADYINAQQDANPTDDEWKALRRRKSKLFQDARDMKARATAIRDAAIAAK